RSALRKVRPTEFEDLVALVALYRPGAMDQIPNYARGKREPDSVRYPDERLRAITSSTKGVIIYQEQSMQIAKTIAGFSGAKADDLRKAIGKKDRAGMAQLKPEFFSGAAASGTQPAMIEELWTTNEKSADYSFNKSHAACYALISYRTAWLKANYPAEYMAALISSVMDTKDKVPFFVAQTGEMGIEILPPDVNVSDHQFVVVDGKIRFGLDAVKGVGFAAVEAIKAARKEGGEFDSLWDFCARVDPRAVNKRSIDSLIKSGAFGTTGASRKGMIAVLEQAQAAGQKKQKDHAQGQANIFDLVGGGPAVAGLGDRCDGDVVTVGGVITESKKIKTRKGDPMMFATLDDLEATVELVIFGKVLAACESALAGDSVVIVRGRIDHKDASKTSIVVQAVDVFTPTPAEIASAREKHAAALKGPPTVHLRVDAATLDSAVIDELKHLLENFPGESEVVLEMQTKSGPRRLRLGREFRVSACAALHSELHGLLGGAVLSGAA
ncbi:MAG: DNA polymerase III subunit alpha, partial [Solirubrobacterales bacterium]|nr:DNA polymerase III subunit alpha [Solirubrobacterales bacterium]